MSVCFTRHPMFPECANEFRQNFKMFSQSPRPCHLHFAIALILLWWNVVHLQFWLWIHEWFEMLQTDLMPFISVAYLLNHRKYWMHATHIPTHMHKTKITFNTIDYDWLVQFTLNRLKITRNNNLPISWYVCIFCCFSSSKIDCRSKINGKRKKNDAMNKNNTDAVVESNSMMREWVTKMRCSLFHSIDFFSSAISKECPLNLRWRQWFVEWVMKRNEKQK